MLQKIKNIVLQDVKSKNELNKVSVILRLDSIIMCIYFICLLSTFYITGEIASVLLCIPCFFAYALSFYTTYIDRTRLAVVFAHVLTIVWIIFFIRSFGWDCGAQNIIFVLIVLNFTTSYSRLRWKLVKCFLFCLFRLSLFAYTNFYLPIYPLEPEMIVMFQIINSVFSFIAITAFLAVSTDDTQEREKKLVIYNERLHRLASIDPLTGLLNRRSMLEYLEKKVDDCKCGRIDNLTIAIGDIDFFKKVNDTYGHECGDMVLRQLALVFSENLEETGEISRWGGEEFLLAFNNINGDDALIHLAELQKKVKALEIPYKDNIIKVTMTFGLGEFDFHRGLDYSINDVDRKMYQGKETGRDKIVY